MKTTKRTLSLILCVVLLISCLSAWSTTVAFADEETGEIGLPSVYDTERLHDALSPVAAGKEVVCEQQTFDQVNAYFEAQHWTDGVAITVPTEDKVNKYLLFTPYASNQELMNGKTVYTVAVNCVMSGCTPQLMPVCVALVEAMDEYPNLIETLQSSHASTPYAWINGPIARQLGLDCEQGMISDTENKELARFINLALKNIAGVDVNDNSATFGTIEPFVFAEDEASCLEIGWNPYHVELGYDLNDNTLTFSTAACWGNNVIPDTPDAEKIMQLIADDITEKQDSALGAGNAQSTRTVMIVQPIARNLTAKYSSKSALVNALVTTAQRPLSLRAYAKWLADPEGSHSDYSTVESYYQKLLTDESDLITRNNTAPDWYFQLVKNSSLKMDTISTIKASETHILVCGDPSRNKAQTTAGGVCETVEIKLPAKWDALLAQINQDPKTFRYLEPISTFCLGDSSPNYNTSEALTSEDTAKFSEPLPLTMYSVVSPVGTNTIDMITQAHRLTEGLEGKTVALVGRSFGAPVTQAVLKELFEADGVTVLTLDDVGYGGSYSVFNPSDQTKEFQAKLIEKGVDAVIAGNCGCGLCTVKESGSSIAAEYIGIPTVTVGAPAFIPEIHSTGVNRGVPVLRTVMYPRAFAAETTEQLQYEAARLYPEIVEKLTTEITPAEIQEYANDGERAYDDIIVSGTYEMVNEYAKMVGWSDGLPIAMATKERVNEYLKYTPYAADYNLGAIPVAYRNALVYTVAVNAAMADVPPEYMPICIAFVQCMKSEDWRKTLSSTHGWSPYAWINGPVARQLGISCGDGMMNEANNKKLARFIDLAMMNIGGYYIKENRMGTYGYLTPWTFSEDEEACQELGWNPYHVDQGYNWNDNTVTAASALFWGADLTPQTSDATTIKDLVAFDITEKQQNALGNTSPQVYRTQYITKATAQKLTSSYPTKNAYYEALKTTARRPLWLRVYAHYWANPSGTQVPSQMTIQQDYGRVRATEDEDAKLTDVPVWYQMMLGTGQIETGATLSDDYGFPILITGKETDNRVQILPGGGYATVKIELPNNWDELMAAKGYRPLSEYYLVDEEEPEEPGITGPITVSDILPDATYRIMLSKAQVTASGRLYADANGNLTYYTSNTSAAVTTSDYEDLATIISALGTSSSIRVQNGKISVFTIRPAVVNNNVTTKDISALNANVFKEAEVVLEVAANTLDGAGFKLSDTVNSFKINLGDRQEIVWTDTPGFLTQGSNGFYSLDSSAAHGSEAVIGVEQADGTYKAFHFFKDLTTVTVTYDADYVPPAEEPTETPTEPPTVPPTEPSTVPSTEPEEVYILGDADGDGDITIIDATVIQRRLVDLPVPDPEIVELCGDINSDGLDIIDATFIQRYLVDIYVPYPIGEPIT